MSVKVMSLVWDAEGLSPTHRLILLSLADHANDEGVCYPSVGRLAKRTGLSERAVQGAVAALQAAGWLRVERNAGPKGCNLFTVCPPAGDAPYPRSRCTPAADAPPQEMRHPPQEMRPTPAADAPEPSGTIRNRQKELPIGSSRARMRKPELPIPENWTPSDRNLSDARDRHFSDEEIRHEAAQFRDHHIARGTLLRDWDAAWRTWLGNARKFAPRVVAGRAISGGRGQGSSLASVVARRRLEGGV